MKDTETRTTGKRAPRNLLEIYPNEIALVLLTCVPLLRPLRGFVCMYVCVCVGSLGGFENVN